MNMTFIALLFQMKDLNESFQDFATKNVWKITTDYTTSLKNFFSAEMMKEKLHHIVLVWTCFWIWLVFQHNVKRIDGGEIDFIVNNQVSRLVSHDRVTIYDLKRKLEFTT